MHQSNPNIQRALEINISIAVAHAKAIKTYQRSMYQRKPKIQITVEIISSSPHVKAIKTYQRSMCQSNPNIQITVEIISIRPPCQSNQNLSV